MCVKEGGDVVPVVLYERLEREKAISMTSLLAFDKYNFNLKKDNFPVKTGLD